MRRMRRGLFRFTTLGEAMAFARLHKIPSGQIVAIDNHYLVRRTR